MAKVWLIQAVIRNEDGQVIGRKPPISVLPEQGKSMLKQYRDWELVEKDHEDGCPVARGAYHGVQWVDQPNVSPENPPPSGDVPTTTESLPKKTTTRK